MNRLTVIRPVSLTESMLLSSDVAESDYTNWSNAATYALGARVIKTHRIWESLQAANTNHDPESSITWWTEVGPTNRWRCFDGYNSTQTVSDGGEDPTITYVLKPGIAINSVGVLNITGATQLSVTMTDDVYGAVYSASVDLITVPTAPDWWSWFFGLRRGPSQHVLTDLPSFPNAETEITMTGGADLAVGVIAIGQAQSFGIGAQSGARVGITDYSRKETSAFGDAIFVERAYAKRASFSLLIQGSEIDALQAYLASVRATPCVWIASKMLEAVVLFGFYKSFEILIGYPEHAECSLEVEGLT